MDVLHALLSFARSEEYVGVLLPNEELRGLLSMLGEDDGDILPVMVVVILFNYDVLAEIDPPEFWVCQIRRLWIPQDSSITFWYYVPGN